jgi:hypothetical protein
MIISILPDANGNLTSRVESLDKVFATAFVTALTVFGFAPVISEVPDSKYVCRFAVSFREDGEPLPLILTSDRFDDMGNRSCANGFNFCVATAFAAAQMVGFDIEADDDDSRILTGYIVRAAAGDDFNVCGELPWNTPFPSMIKILHGVSEAAARFAGNEVRTGLRLTAAPLVALA